MKPPGGPRGLLHASTSCPFASRGNERRRAHPFQHCDANAHRNQRDKVRIILALIGLAPLSKFGNAGYTFAVRMERRLTCVFPPPAGGVISACLEMRYLLKGKLDKGRGILLNERRRHSPCDARTQMKEPGGIKPRTIPRTSAAPGSNTYTPSGSARPRRASIPKIPRPHPVPFRRPHDP